MKRGLDSLLVILVGFAVFWTNTSPALAQSNSGREEQPETGKSIVVTGVTLHVAPSLGDAHTQTQTHALERALEAVPRITGLPPFTTPIEAYVLESDEAFREALVARANVPIGLVAEGIGGYAIERNGVMLIFFVGDGMQRPDGDDFAIDRFDRAVFAFAHELAHLAVREATQRRQVPQWLNEGYAQWTAYQVLREAAPETADVFDAADRAVVSSAIHSGIGPLPWASLVTRSRFSTAGTEGWVDLAYGQSTLFVDWLVEQYGRAALAHFLVLLGEGISPTPAFSQTFGPFARVEASFRVSLDQLTQGMPRGARWLTPLGARTALLAIVGGVPREPVHVEIWRDGRLVETNERRLNQTASGLVPIKAEIADGAQQLEVRVRTASLGLMAIRSDEPSIPARVIPAPVQMPISRKDRPCRARITCLAA
jgi:hypothetical protein